MIEANLRDCPPGSLPGSFAVRSDVKKSIKPPWERQLKSEIRQLTPDDYSWRMPRDYSYMGGGLVPTMDGGLPSMLIVVDTSGSMDQVLLDQAFAICRGAMAKGMNPRVAAGDVHLQYPEGRSGGQWPVLLRLLRSPEGFKGGRGGTEMGQVAWEAYENGLEKPEAVVILTDGDSEWPSKKHVVKNGTRSHDRLPPNTIVCVIGDENGWGVSRMPPEIRRHTVFVKREPFAVEGHGI